MVWNPDGKAPIRAHESQREAENEADRLARANKGHRFIVLQSISERACDTVVVIEHRPGLIF